MRKSIIEYILDFIQYLDSWWERYPTLTSIFVGIVGVTIVITIGIIFFFTLRFLGIDFRWLFAAR